MSCRDLIHYGLAVKRMPGAAADTVRVRNASDAGHLNALAGNPWRPPGAHRPPPHPEPETHDTPHRRPPRRRPITPDQGQSSHLNVYLETSTTRVPTRETAAQHNAGSLAA